MTADLRIGDCRDVLPMLAAEGLRAQCCVTSPPYWGLRDYGLPATPWEPVTFTPVAGLPPDASAADIARATAASLEALTGYARAIETAVAP